MGVFEQFPYTNFHELNLDWVLNTIKTMQTDFTTFISQNAIKYADPILWDITKPYEKNTVVVDVSGNGYLSVKAVAGGISIDRTEYWTVIGNFSALWGTVKNGITTEDEGHSTTATKPRVIGELVWLNETLIEVTSDMIEGDAYALGSNCRKYSMQILLTELENAIKNEVAERQDNDAILKNNIDDEILARQNADNTLQDNIDDEILVRQNADNTLQDNIDDEILVRQNADNTLQDNIDDEILARQNADTTLQQNIDAMKTTGIFVNIKDFGAIGDGITDDTIAISKAVSYINENGGILYIPSGHYKVTKGFKITKTCYIYGKGFIDGSGIIDINTSIIKIDTNVNKVVISGIEIGGNDKCKYCIEVGGSSTIIHDCHLHNGINIIGIIDSQLNYIYNNYIATPISNGIVIESIYMDTGDNGIFYNCFDSSIPSNSAVLLKSGGGLRVIGNKFLHYGIAIDIAVTGNTSVLTIVGNSIEAQTSYSIRLNNTGYYSKISITGNQIAGKGIALFNNTLNCVISGNSIQGDDLSNDYAFYLSECSYITITNNDIYGMTGIATSYTKIPYLRIYDNTVDEILSTFISLTNNAPDSKSHVDIASNNCKNVTGSSVIAYVVCIEKNGGVVEVCCNGDLNDYYQGYVYNNGVDHTVKNIVDSENINISPTGVVSVSGNGNISISIRFKGGFTNIVKA